MERGSLQQQGVSCPLSKRLSPLLRLGVSRLAIFATTCSRRANSRLPSRDQCGTPSRRTAFSLLVFVALGRPAYKFEKSRGQQQSLPQTEAEDTLLPQSDVQDPSSPATASSSFPSSLRPRQVGEQVARQLRRRSLDVQDLGKALQSSGLLRSLVTSIQPALRWFESIYLSKKVENIFQIIFRRLFSVFEKIQIEFRCVVFLNGASRYLGYYALFE